MMGVLKAAKERYRRAFDELTDERANVEYIAQTVENCRVQLLQDFSKFVAEEYPGSSASAAAIAAVTAAAEGGSMGQSSGAGASVVVGGSDFGFGGATGGDRSAYGLTSSSVRVGARGAGGGLATGSRLGPGGDVIDQDEEFERMETNLVLSQDPDSLPFFKASKLASARSAAKPSNVRTKPKPFQ